MYGAAEIGTITNLSTFNSKKEGSVGKILKNCDVKILDKNFNFLENNKVGTVFALHISVSKQKASTYFKRRKQYEQEIN